MLLFIAPPLLAQQAPRPFIGTYSVSATRDSNSTAYAAGDVVSGTTTTAFSFTADWTRGAIVGARMTVDTVVVTNGTFMLFLFKDTTGIGALADNAAFSPTRAVEANIIAAIPLTLVATGTASATAAYAQWPTAATDWRKYFSGTTRIYGVLTALAAYVPTYAGTIGLSIVIAPD